MPREAGSLLGLKVIRDSIFLHFSVSSPVAVKQLLHLAENRCHGASPHELQLLFVLLSLLCVQVVGGKMTETGRLGAFITKVKKGSLADVVGHLRAGANLFCIAASLCVLGLEMVSLGICSTNVDMCCL